MIYSLFELPLAILLNLYERFVLYRLRAIWGIAHLRRISRKGCNVRIQGYSRILDPEGLQLDDDVRIGYNAFLFCKGGISIGRGTIISRNVTIYSANHEYDADFVPYGPNYVNKPVRIGRGVWIGMNACILPGVTIGDCAIIGMGAVISRDVEAGSIVGGQPPRVLGRRDQPVISTLLSEEKFLARHYPEA